MKLLNRLIIFLIRLKFHLKKGQGFQFANQKTSSLYYFSDDALMKVENRKYMKSHVSLNWLLDKQCEIVLPTIGAGDYEVL